MRSYCLTHLRGENIQQCGVKPGTDENFTIKHMYM